MFELPTPTLEMGREAARLGRYEPARRAFEAAADRGDPRGFYELGLLYWYGRGAPRSLDKAVALLKLAAERDYADAQHQLSLALFPTDRVASERWLVRAAGQGHAGAMTRLAEIFGERDPVAARGLLARAAEQGHPPAMVGYGHVMAAGLGGPRDLVGAAAWLYAALTLTGDCDIDRDLRAIAKSLSARQIAQAHELGRDYAKRFRRPAPP